MKLRIQKSSILTLIPNLLIEFSKSATSFNSCNIHYQKKPIREKQNAKLQIIACYITYHHTWGPSKKLAAFFLVISGRSLKYLQGVRCDKILHPIFRID